MNESLVDSFNIPIFFPTPSEVKQVVARNKQLDIERILEINYPRPQLSTPEGVRLSSLHIRAVTEGLLCKHFGSSAIDDIFERHCQKLEELSKTPRFSHTGKVEPLFLLVKRSPVC